MQRIKNIFHLLSAFIAAAYYGFPARKVTVIGITGTDGKTSTCNLLYHILKLAKKKVSLISTIAADIGGERIDTGFHVTTPSPFFLQKLICQAVKRRSKYLVLEVTSHALDQYRIWGTAVKLGLITNISHEHLDYHRTFANYRDVKAKILKGVKYSILNRDDVNFEYLQQKAHGTIITYSLKSKADFRLSDFRYQTKLFGNFHLYNMLAAATIASVLKIDKKIIEEALSSYGGIPGRMENIKNKRNINIFIDFAHKPNALKEALLAVKQMTKGKVIAVFGSAGLRDSLKRPVMGEIAAKLADCIVLTAEDPRTEDVRDIISQIASGCKKKGAIELSKKFLQQQLNTESKYFWRIPDRQEAISFAIHKLAKQGDTVITLGKGHEQSMCYGRTEYPWNEKKAIEKALYDKNNNFISV